MISFDSAILLAHLAGATNKGFFALASVQFLGVVLAMGLTFYINGAAIIRPIPVGWHIPMQVVVWVVLGLTIFVAVCQKDFGPQVWEAFGGDPAQAPFFLTWFDLGTATLIYFLADFAALAFLIYATGGPQHSVYATFLFVLVPTSIALGQPSVRKVVVFAAITLVIFLTLLWAKPPKYLMPLEDRNLVRKVWLGLVTAACVLFPTLVFCIQSWGSDDTAAAATP